MKKKHIAIEGLDFAGKTSISSKVCHLSNVHIVRNPYDSRIGADFKQMVETRAVSDYARAAVHSAVNMELYYLSQLNPCPYIIFERFYGSTVVYNAGSEQMIDKIFYWHEVCQIDNWLFLDIEMNTFLSRSSERDKDNYEKMTANRFEEVREKYLKFLAMLSSKTKAVVKIVKNDTELQQQENVNLIKSWLVD